MSARPFHHQRPLAAAAAAYGIGVWAGVLFSWRPLWWAAGLGASVLTVLLLPVNEKRRVTGFMACALFLGLLLGGFAAHPSLPEAGRCQVTGVLSADTVLREDGTAAGYLENVRYTGEAGERTIKKLYWTYTPDEEELFLPREGDRVTLTGKIYHPSGRVNPYGFDFRMYLLQKGVAAGVSGATDAMVLDHPGRGLASVIYGIQQSLGNRLRQVFGEESPLPEALLLGQKSNLPEETKQGFTDAGAAHLLAVSGLHVGLMAGLLLIPLRRWIGPKGQLAALSVFLLCYCAILDFSAPVVRASVLLLLAMFQRIVRRAPDPVTTLCAAFWFILLFRPLDLFSASFQLSFCAVLGMIVFSPLIAKPLEKVRPQALRAEISATFTATMGSLLPAIQIFHKFSLIGLLVNPVLCALFAVLLPAYAMILIVGCVSLPAGMWLGSLIRPVTQGMVSAVKWLGNLPFATVRTPQLPWYCVWAAVLFAAMCTRYVAVKPFSKKLAIGGAAVVMAFGVWRLTVCRDVQYVQLAMGQADSALILDGGETVVIDTGKYGGDTASYLLASGRRADHLILTHLHSDHCGGVAQLLEDNVPIGEVILPEGAEEQLIDPGCLALLDTLREMGAPIRYMHAGDSLQMGRVTLTATWPLAGTVRPGQNANRYCLALLCDLDGVKLLTTGDLTGDYEMYAAADADILKVAHHGSKNSTGREFLQAVTPEIALIPANAGSAVLPHPDMLERLAEAGIPAYHTGEWGALTITVRNGEATLIPYLNHEETK